MKRLKTRESQKKFKETKTVSTKRAMLRRKYDNKIA